MPLLREFTDCSGRRRPDAGDGAGRARGVDPWWSVTPASCRSPPRPSTASCRRRAHRSSRRTSGTLLEFARVARPGARLALFHPIGRAALAARRGREVSPDDIRAEAHIKPLLRRLDGNRCTFTTAMTITWPWPVAREAPQGSRRVRWRERRSAPVTGRAGGGGRGRGGRSRNGRKPFKGRRSETGDL